MEKLVQSFIKWKDIDSIVKGRFSMAVEGICS
jgi:hypothetical protein